MTSISRRLAAGACTCVLVAVAGIAHAGAQTSVGITAGDGGLVERDCASGSDYVRVDSSSLPRSRACFFLVKSTGWVAVNVTGSYGIVNELKVPVSVAFKLPEGDVYWQRVIDPGAVQNIDVDRRGSTIVEIQVTPVATSTGAATGDLSVDTQSPNVVSLRSAGRVASGTMLRLSWTGVELSTLDRNSGFNDRLDASFRVVSALDGSQCVSLEAAGYPGIFLTMQHSGAVVMQSSPSVTGATWCVSQVAEIPTGVRLASAVNQNRVLTVGADNGVGTTTARTSESVWFADQALAFPGK